MPSSRASAAIVLLAIALCVSAPAPARLPPDFDDSLVAAIAQPTALAFLPDGRLLVAQQTGALRLIKDGVLLPQPALDLTGQICSNRERGLLGIAVDPFFETNRFVYLYYIFKKFSGCPVEQGDNPQVPVARVGRFRLRPGSDQLDRASEVVIVDNIPSAGGYHVAGDLHFGPDGFLYISVGDGGCDYTGDSGCQSDNDAARDQNILLGKILRVTRDGEAPLDNPNQGAGTAQCNLAGRTSKGMKCRETYASGLRNPFRFAFDLEAAAPRLFVNDVGGSDFEEINLGQRGADYGWNCKEGSRTINNAGPCNPTPNGLTPPLFSYAHRQPIPWSTGAGWPGGVPPSNCHSVTGGAFVPRGLWPGFDGAYLWSDYVCGGIFALRSAGSGYAAADFATALGSSSAVSLLFGPDGNSRALYYTTYAEGGQVRRIRYTGGAGNHAPTAALTATPLGGALPLTVSFDAGDSHDPDAGDTLQYLWIFGDGSAQQTTTLPTVRHTYTTVGTLVATLRARDQHGALSLPVSVTIAAGNEPPLPVILEPVAGELFAVGDQVHLRGSATDPEQGALPASALSWTVLLHHNNDHTHPFFGPTVGNDLVFAASPPEDLDAAAASHLEVFLTATDAQGLNSTVSRLLFPQQVPVTFATDPPGLLVTASGLTLTGPETVVSWENYRILAHAVTPQFLDGKVFLFDSWSDGGAITHEIPTPAASATFTASFFSPADSALTLRAERFRVAVIWKTADGQSGAGHAQALTDDSGDFWFFSAGNLEVIVKVLDGCGLNQRYWFFAGGLTNVETTILVTDTLAGATRTYVNPQSTAFRPIQDTNAFATCP